MTPYILSHLMGLSRLVPCRRQVRYNNCTVRVVFSIEVELVWPFILNLKLFTLN